MLKLFKSFKHVDEKVFSLIADIKSSEQYSSFNQKICSLDDNLQKLIQYGFYLLVLGIPVFVVLTMTWLNYSHVSQINAKKEILRLSEQQLHLIRQVQSFNNTLVASNALNSEDDLKMSLSSNPLLAGLTTKLSFDNFNQAPIAASFRDSSVQIKFSEISTPDLANFIKFLYEQFKARVSFITITRNDQNKLIMGEMSVSIISTN